MYKIFCSILLFSSFMLYGMDENPIFEPTIPQELRYQPSIKLERHSIQENGINLLDYIDSAYKERKKEKREQKKDLYADLDLEIESDNEFDEIFIESMEHPYKNSEIYEVKKVDGEKILIHPYQMNESKMYFITITEPINLTEEDYISVYRSELVTCLEKMHNKPKKRSSLVDSLLSSKPSESNKKLKKRSSLINSILG